MTAWPCACSGERYCAVPMIEPVSVISDAPARAMPKSVTLAWPLSSTITLCGLKSRWMTPRRWAKPAAARIWRPRSIARSWSSGASAATTSLSVRPAQVLHRDVVGAVVLAAVVDADHVRVLQAGGGRGLAAEALDELVVLGEAAVQHLERDLAAEVGVLGAVDVGHPARADPVDDPVAAVDERVVGDLGHPLPRAAPPAPAWRSARPRCRPGPACARPSRRSPSAGRRPARSR